MDYEDLDENGSYAYRRRRDRKMPTLEERVNALWEMLVERRPAHETGIDDLQARRVAVKARHPKPTREGV